MKTFRLTALLLFLTSILFTCFSQKVEKGMIHFPTPGKSCQDILKLSGEWQFHPGNFLSAKEMLERKADEKQFMMVPSNWMDGSPDGKTMPAFGDATYFLQIVLDSASTDSPNSFGIRISDITSAYELYVNDKKVMGVGRVGKNGNAFEPGFCPQAGFFETEGDTINVIIHASNYFYPNFSGISRPILFGQEAPVIRKNLLLSDASFLLICIFGILFVFQLIIFIANPRETSNLIISLLALIFLFKILLDSELSIFNFLPDFNFRFGYRIWLLSFMAIPLVFSLIYQSFPKELNFRVTLILHTLYTVWAILVLTLPIHLILEHLYIMIGFSIVCILYLFFATGLAVFRKRNYSMAHFFSLIFLIICALFDLVMISNPRDVFFLSQFGACIYLMIQSLLILLRLIRAHKLSLRLTKELEKTNQNLENMVESRTLELQGSKRELEKNVQHTDFLIKTISHDLKSSFHILMSFSDMLLKEENQAGQQRELLQAMSVTSRNSHEMLDNILGWARIQKNGSAERHIIRNLDGIIHSCMSQLNDRIIAKSLNIKTGIDKTLTFSCDEAQLENILLNLLSNGIKFCAPGSDISFSNNLSNEKVEIHIQDSGIGIAPDMLANLFDYTKDKRRKGTSGELGSGLGLFIVHELVENNDGEIACTSEVGQGTHFILRFPFAE